MYRLKGDSDTQFNVLKTAIRHTWAICTGDGNSSLDATLLALGLSHANIKQEKLVTHLSKICRYWEICQNLTLFARDFSLLARNLQVEAVKSYKSIQSRICTPGHPNCFVHAEIQLVFYYTTHKLANCYHPRIIGTSKAACYLCDLFIKYHGKYFISKTHGHLYDQWTVPDLANVEATQQAVFRAVLKRMNKDILRITALNKKQRIKRAFPVNSWTSFHERRPLSWAPDSSTVLTVENLPQPLARISSESQEPHIPKDQILQENSQFIENDRASEVQSGKLEDFDEGVTPHMLEPTGRHETDLPPIQSTERLSASPQAALAQPTIPSVSPKKMAIKSPVNSPESLLNSPFIAASCQSSTETLRPTRASEGTSCSVVTEAMDRASMKSRAMDQEQPASLRQEILSTPFRIKYKDLELIVECEDQIRGIIKILPPPSAHTDGLAFIDRNVELSSLRINEDLVLERNDVSRELLVGFYVHGQYVLGAGLEWS